MMNQKKKIVGFVVLLFFSFVGCKERGESFISPYYEKLLSCMDEDHPYRKKALEHGFELVDDLELYKEDSGLVFSHVAFGKNSQDICRIVRVEGSWWDSLPDEYANEEEANTSELPRKRDVVAGIFVICLLNSQVGHTDFENITNYELMLFLDDLSKMTHNCGSDAMIEIHGVEGFSEILNKSTLEENK